MTSATGSKSGDFSIGRSLLVYNQGDEALLECSDDGFTLHLPSVADRDHEVFPQSLPKAKPTCDNGHCIWDDGVSLFGVIMQPVTPDSLVAQTESVYDRIFSALGQRRLYRVWNFVPQINATVPPLEENYRLFCVGRARAFENRYDQNGTSGMSAASAVGTGGRHLVVIYHAGTSTPLHLENPEQTPAYKYPQQYGPKAPSFTRGTLVTKETGSTLYVSGTAAIRGSESHYPGDTLRQLQLTIENIERVVASAGMQLKNGANRLATSYRVYIRHWTEQPLVSRYLEQHLLSPSDHVSFVQADICRADLLVEVEATLEC